ncbi:transcriptional regulator [Paenibacillus baekrokdamisoli]|uniref:Transcriptional regulator n=1 Tax=Paenibacillus baekrokdamisoli TaxID=1712516 RepID=A0A3G9IWD2_9BACL|nr:PadR family transcriptional regulator [Paenibacillus baekrokdamisoli]MBB3068130.1 DNA-binding PadR family transcriptional regulator [Paenibacillus baekrokdamisoli]BBH22826.1 transcriptional regulator [Paenibacillus baekrokdamisoli]
MNALSYALLSVLNRKPFTGYELKKMMELFWQAKYSQIYPLLTKLEQDELLTFELIGQTSKPDKKIYSITEKGVAALKEWVIHEPASTPVMRDEFLVKLYAIGLTDPETARRIFNERLAAKNTNLARLQKEIDLMESQPDAGLTDMTSKLFGRYLLYKRKFRLEKEEIEWVNWAMSFIPQ